MGPDVGSKTAGRGEQKDQIYGTLVESVGSESEDGALRWPVPMR